MSTAAVTIVARNYLAFARVLAKSFLAHHPGSHFYVYLCDSKEGTDEKNEPFEFLYADDVLIPYKSLFFTQYSILEANTAVKPFVLEHLLFNKGYDKAIYIDPDIQIFRPMKELQSALKSSNIVLIPHMLRPFDDQSRPTELNILQSGTYNLGFLGLSRSQAVRDLLHWWGGKLFRECVVDIPRGLFVDQKWMDLSLGYFEKVSVLRDSTYNVAYWNLHEREISFRKGVPHAEGKPLTFFHYSGYSPFQPHTLSKHQDRHKLSELPEVKRLCDAYAELLLAEGHIELSSIPYGYETLPNGVELSPCMRRALRIMLSRNVPLPDPWEEPDDFVRMFMTRNEINTGMRMVPLQKGLLEMRNDVSIAFPQVWQNSSDPKFWEWMNEYGRYEMDCGDVLDMFPKEMEGDLVGEVFRRLDEERRKDVYRIHADMWFSTQVFSRFCAWIRDFGQKELGLTKEHAEAMARAQGGVMRVLSIYLRHDELQTKYPDPTRSGDLSGLRRWLIENSPNLDLSIGDISLFEIFCRQNPSFLQCVVGLYGAAMRKRLGRALNVFSFLNDSDTAQPSQAEKKMVEWLLGTHAISAVDQLQEFFLPGTFKAKDGLRRQPLPPEELKASAEKAWDKGEIATTASAARSIFMFVERGLGEAKGLSGKAIVNVAGFFNAPSGMGYSGHSMVEAVQSAAWEARTLTLPTYYDEVVLDREDPAIFGWPSSMAALSIAVANADTSDLIRSFCPATFWSPVNIGYWVWETENFPSKFADSARGFDAILTPSRHSADAISSQIDIPVHVVPHIVDADGLSQVAGRRKDYGLPEDAVLFGYFFDSRSSLERKNPQAAVRAFCRAFGRREDVLLVLKVSGCNQGDFDYQMFRSEIKSLNNVRLIEATYSRERTLGLMSCLDVYVSLHRAEGFGLTCAEAMAMGKPVVTTNYSGNRDFMDMDSACMVPAKIVATDRQYGAYPRGSRWAEPDVEAAAEFLYKLLDADKRNAMGSNAQETIRKKLTAQAVGETLKGVVSQYIK